MITDIKRDAETLNEVFKNWPKIADILHRVFNLNVNLRGTEVIQQSPTYSHKYLMPRSSPIMVQPKPELAVIVDYIDGEITHTFHVEIPHRLLVSTELDEQEEKLKPIRNFDDETKAQLRFAYILHQLSKQYYADLSELFSNRLYQKYRIKVVTVEHKQEMR